MGVRARVRQESSPPGKREQDGPLPPIRLWDERSLAPLSLPNPLETGEVGSGEETVLVLATIGAPSWDCRRSLVHGFPDRAVAHFDIPAHSVLAGRLCKAQ